MQPMSVTASETRTSLSWRTRPRKTGRAAALRAKEVELGKLTLAHVDEWNKQVEEAGIENPIVSPILLPDYTRKVR